MVHAGASGVGTAAIQLIREAGAEAMVTAGSKEKLDRCRELGATAGWNYKDGSFAPWVKELTEGKGVDLILDFVGAPYFKDNVDSLAVDGRLIIIGTLGGAKVRDVNLTDILMRRLSIVGTALRSRSVKDKIKLTQEFSEYALPRFADGRLQPVIDKRLRLAGRARSTPLHGIECKHRENCIESRVKIGATCLHWLSASVP